MYLAHFVALRGCFGLRTFPEGWQRDFGDAWQNAVSPWCHGWYPSFDICVLKKQLRALRDVLEKIYRAFVRLANSDFMLSWLALSERL